MRSYRRPPLGTHRRIVRRGGGSRALVQGRCGKPLVVADVAGVGELYEALLTAWNDRDARRYSSLFADDASVVGFDGSCVETAAGIEGHLAGIFTDHQTARYVWIVREVRTLGDTAALLRAVVGMVPSGEADLAPAANAIQSLTAVHDGRAWRIAHFQNTPAAFHGRPDEAEELTRELRASMTKA